MDKPTIRQLSEATGISRTYACDILNSNQTPSLRAAIHIYRKTGWRHDLIADLSDLQIDTLELAHPWRQAA
jgi:hypothetical protein